MHVATALIIGTGSKSLRAGLIRQEHRVFTEYGTVPLHRVTLREGEFILLERHGPGHERLPHEIPHMANMAALKQCGVGRVLAVAAVGSLTTELQPGDVVLVDDFIALHRGGFDERRHLDVCAPCCPGLRAHLISFMSDISEGKFVEHGTYVEVPGPRYETPAEVRLYSAWGGHVVGMTSASEAIAARLTGLCYACLACVTNLGTGLGAQSPDHTNVTATMDEIVKRLRPRLISAALTAHTLPACETCRH